MQTPPEVGALIETVGRYSLYRNCEWLLESDPALARIIAPESGGSAGAWPFLWHTGYLSSEDVRESLTQFFDFEDDLLRRLDAFRVGLLG